MSYLPPTLAPQRKAHNAAHGRTNVDDVAASTDYWRMSPHHQEPYPNHHHHSHNSGNAKAQSHRGGSGVPLTKRSKSKTDVQSNKTGGSGSKVSTSTISSSAGEAVSATTSASSSHQPSVSIQRTASRYLGDDNNWELSVEAHKASVSPMRSSNNREKNKEWKEDGNRRKQDRGRSAGRNSLSSRENSENNILDKKRQEMLDSKPTAEARATTNRSRSTTRYRRREEDSAKSLRLKCKRGNDTRLVVIDQRMSFENLQQRLDADYGFPVTLRYEDDEGDKIILSSENDLKELLRHQSGTVLAYIEQRPAATHASNALLGPTPTPASQLEPISSQNGTAQSSRTSPSSQFATSETLGSAGSSVVVTTSQVSTHDRHTLLNPLPATSSNGGIVSDDAANVTSTSTSYEESQKRQLTDGIRWQRGEVLGAGAFGTVYLGLRTDTGQLMAVKQLCIDEVSAKELAVLENEIEMLKDLQHANIVQYIGTERKADSLCIFLEYVPGGSLKRLLNRFGPLEEDVVRLYTRQILRGLEYLHSNGIAHRDIKGANVLVGNNGTVKLADFGASKRLSQLSVIDPTSSLNASGPQGMKGTPLWMAPEVARSDKTTARGWKKADVWSVACTVIEMLTASPPWPDCGNPMVALYQLAYKNEAPPFPEELSPTSRDFLNQCFRSEPDNRPDVTSLLLHPFVSQIPSNILAMANDVTPGLGYPVRPSTADNKPPSLRGGQWGQSAWQQREQSNTKGKNEASRRAASAIISNTHHNKENLSAKERGIQRGGTAIGIQNPKTTKAAQVMSDFDFTPVEVEPDVEESSNVKKPSRAASAGPRSSGSQNKAAVNGTAGDAQDSSMSRIKRVQSAKIGVSKKPTIDEDSLDEVSIMQIDDSEENSLNVENNEEDAASLESYTERAVEQAVENFHSNCGRERVESATSSSFDEQAAHYIEPSTTSWNLSHPPRSPLVSATSTTGKHFSQCEEQSSLASRGGGRSSSPENLLEHVTHGSKIPVPSRLVKRGSSKSQRNSFNSEGAGSFKEPTIDTTVLQAVVDSDYNEFSVPHSQTSSEGGELPRLSDRRSYNSNS